MLLEIQDKFNQFIEIGNISRRIWKPSPFLEEVLNINIILKKLGY